MAHTTKYLREHAGVDGAERENPLDRSAPGQAPLTQHYKKQAEDRMEQLQIERQENARLRAELEIANIAAVVDSAIADLREATAGDADETDDEEKSLSGYLNAAEARVYSESFSAMRKATRELAEVSPNKVVPYTVASVRKISEVAPAEWSRFVAQCGQNPNLLNSVDPVSSRGPRALDTPPPTLSKQLSKRQLLRMESRERRAISAFFLSLGATSERMSSFRRGMDVLFQSRTRADRDNASQLGLGQALRSQDRQDKKALAGYRDLVDSVIACTN